MCIHFDLWAIVLSGKDLLGVISITDIKREYFPLDFSSLFFKKVFRSHILFPLL